MGLSPLLSLLFSFVDEKSFVDEEVLVTKVREGEVRAFDQLFHLYSPRLFHFALGYLKSKEDAEEIVQDVFVKIWERRQHLRPDFSFKAYVFKIAFNAILNRIRKRGSERAFQAHLHHHKELTHNETENSILLADLERFSSRAVDQLPSRRQLIYRMSRQDGLTNQQIADHLHISPKTVEVQMSEALKFLRKQLSCIRSDLFLLLFLLLQS